MVPVDFAATAWGCVGWLAVVEELSKVLSFLLKPEAKSMCSYCSSRKSLGTNLGLLLPCLLWPKPLNPTFFPLPRLAWGFPGAYLPALTAAVYLCPSHLDLITWALLALPSCSSYYSYDGAPL